VTCFGMPLSSNTPTGFRITYVDIATLPLTSKADLRQAPDSFLSRAVRLAFAEGMIPQSATTPSTS
jgi:hypothetical protein